VQWPMRAAEVSDGRVRRVMLNELLAHFGTFDRGLVERAASKAIASCEFWPPIATLVKFVSELRELPPASRPLWRADPEEDRYHAVTPEESERRKLLCQKWRKQYGLATDAKPAPETIPDPVTYDVPESDLSPELRALMRKRNGFSEDSERGPNPNQPLDTE